MRMFMILALLCLPACGPARDSEIKASETSSETIAGQSLKIGYRCEAGMAVTDDMVLGPCPEDDKPGSQAFFRSFSYSLWPNATIPYTIHPELEPIRQQ